MSTTPIPTNCAHCGRPIASLGATTYLNSIAYRNECVGPPSQSNFTMSVNGTPMELLGIEQTLKRIEVVLGA